MEGIQFVTNDKGKKVAVMIDLRKHGEVWEDFYDSWTARLPERMSRASIGIGQEATAQARQAQCLTMLLG